MKGWHISRTYQVVALLVFFQILFHPLLTAHYFLPPLMPSRCLSGALTVARVKSMGSLCKRGQWRDGGWEGVLILPQVESRGEGFVRGNGRSVDPPATDYPPS